MNKITLGTLIFGIALVGTGIWYWKHISNKQISTEENTVIVGTNAEFPPFSFVNDQGEIIGFDIDIAREVCKRIDKKMVVENMSFDALIPALQLGAIHIIAAGITPTQERSAHALFTKPYIDCDPLIIISTQQHPHTENSASSLQGKTIIVNQGYTSDMFVSALQQEYNTMNIIRLSSALIGDGLLALQSGRADVFIASRSSLQSFLDQAKTQEFIISKPIINGCIVAGESYALAISKKHPELLPIVQKALDNMQADGTILTLQHTWELIHD